MGDLPVSDGSPSPLWIRAIRFDQWWYFALLPLTAGVTSEPQRHPAGLSGLRLAVAVLCAAMALSFAYFVNAIADRSTDSNPTKNPLSGRRDVPPSVRFMAPVLAGGSLALALLLGLFPVSTIAVSLLFGTLYSLPPRLKAYPILGVLGNAGIFTPLCFPGFRAPEGITPDALRLTGIFSILLIQNQLLHELADSEEDTAHGDRTTAHRLGPEGTRVVTTVPFVLIAGVFPVLGNGDRSSLLASLTLLAATVASLSSIRDAGRARRIHRLVSLSCGALLFLEALGWEDSSRSSPPRHGPSSGPAGLPSPSRAS